MGEIANIVRGASPRPIKDPKWFDEASDIGWLRISDVTEQNGRVHHLSQHISKLGETKTRVLTEPHILLSIAATVGKPLINYCKTGVHDGFLIFQDPHFNLEFMFQWLTAFENKWQRYGQPGSQVNLNSNIVKNQIIYIPSDKEQEMIEKYLSRIDNLITLHQRKIDKLKKLKSAYLTEMFPAEGERKPKRRFAGFTDDWEQRKLGDIVKITMGQSPNGSSYHTKPIGRILVQGNADLENGYVRPRIWTTQITKEADKGDIIMSVRAPAGEVGKTNYHVVIGRGVAAIKGNEFIYQLLTKMNADNYWKKYSTGSTFESLNLNTISSAEVKLPNLEEQRKIGTHFKQLDNLITLHQRKIYKLKKLKDAYLNEMFV